MPSETGKEVFSLAKGLELVSDGGPEFTNVGSGIVRDTGERRVIYRASLK